MLLETLLIVCLLAPFVIVGIIVLLSIDRKSDIALEEYEAIIGRVNAFIDDTQGMIEEERTRYKEAVIHIVKKANAELDEVAKVRLLAGNVIEKVNQEIDENGGVAGTIGKGVLGCLVTLGAQELGKLSQEQQGKVNMARKGLEVMGSELFKSLSGIVGQLGGAGGGQEGEGGEGNPLGAILNLLGGGGGGGIGNILGMLGGAGGKKKEGSDTGSGW